MKAFISYSRDDRELLKKFEKHLASLKRRKQITTWTDQCIDPGEHWAEKIDQALESADLVILLVSSSFIASDFCSEKEMVRALERHAEERIHVVPVILRPCDWEDEPFGKLQCLPKDGEAITI